VPVVRHGRLGRGARRGAGLKPAGTTTALLRPALEAAVSVARDGERATPPQPAPGPLRRYLSFARLPDPALEVARRVLDDDEGFRARVASAVDERVVGRAGWVFLTRPDGWQAEVDGLRKAAAAQEVASREERSEREASRRLAGAEAAAARSEAAAVAAASEAERLRAELDQERAAARAAANDAERLRAELVRLADERAGAIRRLKEAESSVASRGAEVRELRHELRMAQAELSQGLPPADARAPRFDADPGQPAAAELDRAALAAAVGEAAAAADLLAAALAAAAALVSPPSEAADPQPAPGPGRGRAAPGTRRRPRRAPLRLPPGILDDTPAAAEHLVRSPHVLLLLDGYNISQARWHGMSTAEQRARLLDACAELHARCGADVEVVFDGTGDEPTGGSLVRAAVRYRFSPVGVEADDVVLARVDEEPPARPVVVASSDRRVREGAQLRGANVIGARQLLAVLRR
jgi:predicted RNA-binding protein with PIN domain